MGIRDMLSGMFSKKEPSSEEQAQQYTYTAEKGSLAKAEEKGMSLKAKALLSAILVAGTLGFSGMAPTDAHAAGVMKDHPEVYRLSNPTKEDIARANATMKKIQQQNKFLEDCGVDMNQGAIDFRKGLDPSNSRYTHDSDIESYISSDGANIRGNVRIGRITNDGQDYSNGRW